MIKSNKAITLIALIITIIVLLILAGVTINMVLGENGIFNKAKTSVAKYENAQAKENSVLTGYETEINGYIDGNRDNVTLTQEEYTMFKNLTTFSTEGKVIGKWIDNKNVYQKIVPVPALPYGSGTDLFVDTGITANSIDTLIYMGGIKNNNEALPMYHTDNVHGYTMFFYHSYGENANSFIDIRRRSDNTSGDGLDGGYILLQYTLKDS